MKEMKVVNLTPHPVVVLRDGERIEFPPSGQVARLGEEIVSTGMTIEGVPVVEKRLSGLDLPPVQPGVFYIVSLAVAQVARREDLLVPDDLVRDERGQVIGCRRLARIV